MQLSNERLTTAPGSRNVALEWNARIRKAQRVSPVRFKAPVRPIELPAYESCHALHHF
jgi:hypothetical protein